MTIWICPYCSTENNSNEAICPCCGFNNKNSTKISKKKKSLKNFFMNRLPKKQKTKVYYNQCPICGTYFTTTKKNESVCVDCSIELFL